MCRRPISASTAAGLAALDAYAKAAHGLALRRLAGARGGRAGRQDGGPAARRLGGAAVALLYFVARSDAVDVVYGTQAGFEKLGIPYMAHILPDKDW
jgi:hypothetical protein